MRNLLQTVHIIWILSKLKNIKNEWLLNWVNALLKKNGFDTIADFDEILLNVSALRTILCNVSPNNKALSELQTTLLETLSKYEISKKLHIINTTEFVYQLFKYKYKNKIIISDDLLETEFNKFMTEQQSICGKDLTTLDNGELIKYISNRAKQFVTN